MVSGGSPVFVSLGTRFLDPESLGSPPGGKVTVLTVPGHVLYFPRVDAIAESWSFLTQIYSV